MALVRESTTVALDPGRAAALWLDVRRWPTFVEGFARALRVDDSWPSTGSKVVWESIPRGRGRVTERVTEHDAPAAGGRRVATEVFEEALTGTQTVTFEPAENGTLVRAELDYRLTSAGFLRQLTDVLFIRRALAGALGRTLERFATEAEEEASL